MEACTIRSPIDGVVADAGITEMGRAADGHSDRLSFSAAPGQPVAFVQAPDGRLVFEGEVPEEQASLIRAGQPAQVTVRSGMINRPIPGVVDRVVISADPASAGGLGSRTAQVRVAISEIPPPGSMQGQGGRATATLEVATPEATLNVPRAALVWYDGAYHVGVPGADGAVAWREVEPGLADAETVEIRSGLAAGEAVVADPAPHLSADQLRRISIAPPPADSKLPPPPSMGRGFQ
ncbi:efflux RND transporter periplasmic adaptor subunit [Paludisphaera soli]|uniref:efflux RND transporter periplasmic adaptor subunit n=1 Tax=Paludisphaera soli TaxID=2712865 RepID=UPI0021BCF1C7|nr:HlyD family efflux transporter periplasmic adaptor subunit [Paludisphaera soli]